MRKQVKKRFDIAITGSDANYVKTFELDKNIVAINGLLLSSDRDDLLYYRGSQRIEINGDEIFPEEYESKLLMAGINVSPNERYYELEGKEPGNGKIKVSYKDIGTPVVAFSAYRVSLYLDCEMEEG